MVAKTWDEMRGSIFDSRDIIERIAELEAQDSEDDGSGLDEFERAELVTLESIAADATRYASDWQYGEIFIPEDEFEDYARELAEDIGAIDRDAPWPQSFIDWSAAADALRMDYTEYEFDGITYLAR